VTLQRPAEASPVNEQHIWRIKVKRVQARKLQRDLISAWTAFAGDASAENSRKLDDAVLRAQIFLREVEA
jgi:hypothetical protein